MYAVRRSAPPKQMFVVIGSGISTCSYPEPSGATTVIPLWSPMVATHTLPAGVDREAVEHVVAGQAHQQLGRRAPRPCGFDVSWPGRDRRPTPTAAR